MASKIAEALANATKKAIAPTGIPIDPVTGAQLPDIRLRGPVDSQISGSLPPNANTVPKVNVAYPYGSAVPPPIPSYGLPPNNPYPTSSGFTPQPAYPPNNNTYPSNNGYPSNHHPAYGHGQPSGYPGTYPNGQPNSYYPSTNAFPAAQGGGGFPPSNGNPPPGGYPAPGSYPQQGGHPPPGHYYGSSNHNPSHPPHHGYSHGGYNGGR